MVLFASPQCPKTNRDRLKIANPMFLVEIVILQIMGNFILSSYAPLAHFIKGSFMLNEAAVGLITSATFAGALSINLVSGLIVDNLGPMKTMKISYGILAAGSLIAFLANQYFILVGAYYIIGFGYGMVTPATNSAIMTEYYPRHTSPMGIKQSGVPMGTILATVALPLIVLHYSLRYAFLFLFMIAIVLALLTRGERSYQGSLGKNETIFKHMKEVLKNRTLIVLSLITAFLSWGQQAVFTYFVLFLGSRNFYVLVAEDLFIVLLLGSVIGRMLWPPITQRLFRGHRVKNYSLIMVLIGITFLILPFVTFNLAEAAIMAVLLGFTAVAWNSNYVTLVSEIAPKGNVGTYSALSMVIISVGSILGTPFSGFIVDATGTFSYMWITLGICLVLVSAVFLVVGSRLMGSSALPAVGPENSP